MRIKSIAAVGAMGVGLGIASFIGGTGTASAACDEALTPPLERANCLVSRDLLGGFLPSIDPITAYNTFVNGDPEDTDFGSLGIAHQGETFVNSLTGTGGFLSGPISSVPEGP
ncbi:hypothetical protein [Mycobacterium sp. ITM-2016-00318]|uniref:hypothetical protein n=1 Tax=Mycobacterium sp. ITM-2016-00318 TaxID=2099693 RepID=UPI000CFA7DA0|nr:hypothetical protein [Mycobacterium sp. ITM-2016-00318]WNG92023.1 hypothetical protein C6A82_021685 [Mycobacterium sp. ITM-2016-00318]